jgi:hypothetical protein
VSISLICETPELFAHLPFKDIFDLKRTHPVVGRHLYLNTYPDSALLNQFMSANQVNLIDHASISAIRMQLPPEYKKIKSVPIAPGLQRNDLNELRSPSYVLVHAGRSWASRTFPAKWWNNVIAQLHQRGYNPVLVGSDTIDEIDPMRVSIDMRKKTTLSEFIWLCQRAPALITNDSGPLHLAAPGEGKIAFVATARRGDLLLHERKGGFGWRMKDFARQPMWNRFPIIPNTLNKDSVQQVPEGTAIEDYLPEPKDIVDWITKP